MGREARERAKRRAEGVAQAENMGIKKAKGKGAAQQPRTRSTRPGDLMLGAGPDPRAIDNARMAVMDAEDALGDPTVSAMNNPNPRGVDAAREQMLAGQVDAPSGGGTAAAGLGAVAGASEVAKKFQQVMALSERDAGALAKWFEGRAPGAILPQTRKEFTSMLGAVLDSKTARAAAHKMETSPKYLMGLREMLTNFTEMNKSGKITDAAAAMEEVKAAVAYAKSPTGFAGVMKSVGELGAKVKSGGWDVLSGKSPVGAAGPIAGGVAGGLMMAVPDIMENVARSEQGPELPPVTGASELLAQHYQDQATEQKMMGLMQRFPGLMEQVIAGRMKGGQTPMMPSGPTKVMSGGGQAPQSQSLDPMGV